MDKANLEMDRDYLPHLENYIGTTTYGECHEGRTF